MQYTGIPGGHCVRAAVGESFLSTCLKEDIDVSK